MNRPSEFNDFFLNKNIALVKTKEHNFLNKNYSINCFIDSNN